MERKTTQAGWSQPDVPAAAGKSLATGRPPVISVPDNRLCNEMALVMSYTKMQPFGQPYEAEVGFDRGTIFPELDFPFMGEGACPHNE